MDKSFNFLIQAGLEGQQLNEHSGKLPVLSTCKANIRVEVVLRTEITA